MFTLRRSFPLAIFAIALGILYLYNLNGIGVVGPDEPRYAAIGREMARSGDWVTPVLWGKPWFEKPPLLYWMTAVGTGLGLGPDLCGRLPVALLSLAFLTTVLVLVSREFGLMAGVISTAALATSAGWLTYSSLCLTDLPLAVTFSVALLTACSLLRRDPPRHVRWRLVVIGAMLGLGVLAKGLVPLVLVLPSVWFLRRHWRHAWVAVLGCLLVAAPWYGLVYARNGYPFIQEFFIKHHLQRLYSASLEHTQPPYYFVPVLLAGLFPWTPAFALLWRRSGGTAPAFWDPRRRLLLATAIFGFVFFSISRNKLPHYLLPIIPALFILLGSTFEGRKWADVSRPVLLTCALLTATVPVIAQVLPQMLAVGRIARASLTTLNPVEALMIALPLAIATFFRRERAAVGLAFSAALALFYLKLVAYPAIDHAMSPRAYWQTHAAQLADTCNGGTNRDWLYGISYYRTADFAECQTGHFRYVMRTDGRGAPVLTRLP